jgi:hypothetical protein
MPWNTRELMLLRMLAEVAAEPSGRRFLFNRLIRRAELEGEGYVCEGWRTLKAQLRAAVRLRSTDLAADTVHQVAKRLEAEKTCPHATLEFILLMNAMIRIHDPRWNETKKKKRKKR